MRPFKRVLRIDDAASDLVKHVRWGDRTIVRSEDVVRDGVERLEWQ